MDKNQLTGFILLFALLAAYFTWFAPEPPIEDPLAAESATEATDPTDTTAVEPLAQAEATITPDSVQNSLNEQRLGAFAFAASGKEDLLVFKNDELTITFSNLGGRIKSVVLNKHKDYLGQPVLLMDDTKSAYDYTLDHLGKSIALSDLSFQSQQRMQADTTFLTYQLSNGSFSITQEYQIPPGGFQIGYTMQGNNLNTVLNPTDVTFEWHHALNRTEGNLDDSRLNSNVRYYLTNEDQDELAERSDEFEDETLGAPIQWVSFKQKFFSSAIIADTPFKSGYVTQKVDFADTSSVKDMTMRMVVPYADFVSGFRGRYYFGTNKYDVLKKVAPDFEENLDMGWGPLPIVNKYFIIPIFHFLERFLSNYGIIIIIIVIVIRLILAPLTWKSHMSMAKMRVLKPELDEIKKKNDGDMQKTQQDQMKLYQKVGINPISGCIPMLLQMPILFSLFFFFPNAVELRGESFLWAHDLSTYDSIINLPFTIPWYGSHVSLFTLLMTLSTILYTWSNSQITTVQGPMKTLQYIMPIMFLFVLNSYASGLTFYYFVSNMVTFGQTILFRKVIDEEKILATLEENKKKNANKKKSKFQTRLEDAMKASQEAQRAKKKKK